MPDCVRLTPGRLSKIDWLPPTCAYRLLAEGKELMWWHPLVSGDPETVHRAGVSVRGKAVRERDAGPFEDHVVRWPGQVPRRAAEAPPPPPHRTAATRRPPPPAAPTQSPDRGSSSR